jgi:hypothetical protein
LSIQSENAQFAARSDGTQYAFIIDSGAAVVWDSNRDRLYLDGYNVVSYPGGTDKLPDFATYIKTGSGLLEFAPIYVWQRVIPEPLRIGGSNTNWFLPADKVMLEVQSLNSTSIAAQFKDHQGNKKLEINNTGLGFYGATPAAKPTLAGSCGGNTAVQSIAAALASLGLVTNNTTP